MNLFRVVVDVATVWTSPAAPRPLDAAATADEPDVRAWAATLDASGRLDLHGRTLTQLLRGEPVHILDAGPAAWLRVAAPWQLSPDDDRGYVGWVRAAHVAPGGHVPVPLADIGADPSAVLELARCHLGLPYVWGGTSPAGFDCSGLVHYCLRRAGVVVPRDAYAQYAAAEPVELGTEQAGDLYFFASAGRMHHVGFVTAPRHMLHAPEDSAQGPGTGVIEEAPLTPDRLSTLVAAARVLPRS